jgi:phage tail-like protein
MAEYPQPAYHFSVNWGGTRIGATEVSGLEIERAVTEVRDGSDPTSTARKMPGMVKFSNIVLKRGIITGDNEFFEWFSTAQLNTVERRDMTIMLLNERHEPTIVWKVRSAFPCKYSGPNLKADSSDAAFETLEIAHEGLVVETA